VSNLSTIHSLATEARHIMDRPLPDREVPISQTWSLSVAADRQ
jgi:hypothetical protein